MALASRSMSTVTESSNPRRLPVVDVCGGAFSTEGWRSYLGRFADHAPGYLGAFVERRLIKLGLSPERIETLRTRPHELVKTFVEVAQLGTSGEAHVAHLDREGVVFQILQGGAPWRYSMDLNGAVAERAAAAPGRLTAWAGLDTSTPERSLTELERCVDQLGMTGVYLTPFFDGIPPHDESLDPIYRALTERGLPVWIHAGMTFATQHPLGLGNWLQIDAIAVRHPELRIIVGHGGWPWLLDAVAVMQRHPHVYLDFSAHRGRYARLPGSGWEPLLNYGQRQLSHRVLFGSVEWAHSISVRSLADEMAGLALTPAVAERWLATNAADLLRLPLFEPTLWSSN